MLLGKDSLFNDIKKFLQIESLHNKNNSSKLHHGGLCHGPSMVIEIILINHLRVLLITWTLLNILNI